MTAPRLAPIAAALPDTIPFVGPETLQRRSGIPVRARIGANENPFGPSPAVVEAMRQAAAAGWQYGDPEAHDLRQALAAHLGVPAEAVLPGEGIDALLGHAVRLYVAPGQAVVTSLGAYPTFSFHVAGFGARLHAVPYAGRHEDLGALAAAARAHEAAMVYVANPDNPMGTWWDAVAVGRFLDAVPATTLVVLDEAYGELAPAGTLPPLDVSRRNLLRMRTFSKAYAMAGVRVGHVVGHPDLIRPFDRVRNHFGLGNIAQAGAVAALADAPGLARIVAAVRASLAETAAIARRHGLAPVETAASFLAVDCGRDGPFAQAVLDGLAREGVFVRKPQASGLAPHIRISAGTEADRAILDEALGKVLRALG